jgi:SAM-dependent methyltransferase
MTTPNYDYYGMVASTWDLWRDDTSNWSDRFFYLDIIRQYGQPVLDIGCGTGRLILDYLAEGVDTDGVDNSAEMLAICRAKADKLGLPPNLYQQDMQTLDLPRKYRTILAPSSALQLVTDADKLREALRHIVTHLAPGGALVGSFSFEPREGDPLDSGWHLLFEKVRPEDGATVRSWVHEWHEPDKQLWYTEQRFEVELNGDVIAREEQRRSPEGRWYSQAQAAQVFAEAGLTDIQLFHGFENKPATAEDKLFCVLGVKR